MREIAIFSQVNGVWLHIPGKNKKSLPKLLIIFQNAIKIPSNYRMIHYQSKNDLHFYHNRRSLNMT